MRCVVLTLAGAAVVAALIGAAVVFLGLYNVSAKVGHLPGVSWVLHTTYRNSVKLRAPPEEAVPPLTAEMAAIGARHYETACRFCHGAPHERQAATATAMVPHPPPIVEAVKDWQPRHLFWIVRNGVKMSGMPHWPAEEREDDVWLVVAFLEAAREMSLAEYQALVAPPEGTEGIFAYCATCHGRDGAGRGNEKMPRLDILSETYIAASLLAYRWGSRQSGVMQQAAAMLDDEDIARLAGRFAREVPEEPVLVSAGVPSLAAVGRDLAFGHPDSREVPACRACHGPWPTERAPLFPDLTGQRPDYLLTQLKLWKQGHRGGTGRFDLMHVPAEALSEEQMRALAAYYAAADD